MGKFKKKDKMKNVNENIDKTPQDDYSIKFSNPKVRWLLVAIVLFLFLGIFFTFKRTTENTKTASSSASVNVIEANGAFPANNPVESSKQSKEQITGNPAGNPATIQDLGGDNKAPTNTEQLLEGKDIQINK